MNMEENRTKVEAVKQSMSSLPSRGISIRETMEISTRYLYDLYLAVKNKGYLEVAALQIQAYLELGFAYEDHKEVFDLVLEGLGTDRKTMFPKRFYYAVKVKLNPSQVRSMIGRWPKAKSGTMHIDQVIADIIDKVQNQKYGSYEYENTGSASRYELVINEKECYFRNIQNNRFYTFDRKGSGV